MKTATKPDPVSRTISYRNTSELQLTHLHNAVQSESFLDMYCTDSVDLTFSGFLRTLSYYVDMFCPTVTRTCNSSTTSKTWLSRNILNMGAQLKDLHRLVSNSGNLAFLSQYKQLKGKYRAEIRTAKFQYFQTRLQKLNNYSQKAKAVWNVVREKTGRLKSDSELSLRLGEVIVSDRKIMANEFAKYFSEIAQKSLDDHFLNGITDVHSCTVSSFTDQSFFFSHVSAVDIVDTINNLKNTNSVGIDCISTKIIKHLGNIIAEPLSYVVNLCVQRGEYPDDLKIGSVIPILKKDDPLAIENYRPITVSTVLGRIVEKCMYDQMMSFLTKFNLITSCQNGFYPGRSTETACHDLLSFVYTSIDCGKYVGALFFDLSRAFDTLDLNIVSKKLYAKGFRGDFLSCITSFLSHRKICARVGTEKSDLFDIGLGVPQGSVLGPLIFMLFVDDLPQYISSQCLVAYCDDVAVAGAAESPEELRNQLNIAASEFSDWCARNRLIINSNKTVYLHFYNRRRFGPDSTVTVGRSEISVSATTRYLGTHLDGDLSWDGNIDRVCCRIGRAFYAILQLKTVLEIKQLIDVYYALVYSHINYNIILWGTAVNVGRVFVNQKRVIRLMFSLGPTESCRPIFRHYRIMTLISLYMYRCILFVRGHCSLYQVNSDTHSYPTRNGNDFRCRKHKTALFERSPDYMGCRLFNHLPTGLKTEADHNKFKNRLKTFLLEQCFYSIDEFFTNHNLVNR